MESLVSIITPSYNSARFIRQCVESVISQTYNKWEMIIIDDFSNDNSREIINFLCKQDTRIKPVFLDNNIGAANARNLGIKKSSGKYIAFLDSDDLWDPYKLEKQISFMECNNLAFSYTAFQSISENGSIRYSTIKVPDMITYHDYLKNTIIGCLTVVLDRRQIGHLEMPDIRSSHDMAFWLLILRSGFSAYGLNENLASYRIVGGSNSSNKIKAVKDVWEVYRNIEKLSLLYSLWCFVHYIFYALKKRIL